MHLEDEQIQRALHGELGAPATEAARRHLAGCDQCQLRLAEAEREEKWIFDLLRRTDHAAPSIEAEALATRARARARARGRAVGWGRWAAGIAIAIVAAGAAYTMPGSPLPAWVDRVAEWIRNPAPQAPSPATPATPETPETPIPSPPVTSGIAVVPGERFAIRFAAGQSAGIARVSLTGEPNIATRASNAAVTFTTEPDRLTIDNSGSTADYEIELPHDAPWVEILVGERRLFLKDGQRIVTAAAPDARGRYLLSLSPPGP